VTEKDVLARRGIADGCVLVLLADLEHRLMGCNIQPEKSPAVEAKSYNTLIDMGKDVL